MLKATINYNLNQKRICTEQSNISRVLFCCSQSNPGINKNKTDISTFIVNFFWGNLDTFFFSN